MKRLVSLILSNLIIIGCLVPAFAASVYKGITYEESTDSVSVASFVGDDSTVTIKSEVNGKPVTSIAPQAFEDSAVTAVNIPSSVTFIGAKAFYNCKKLSYVALGAKVTKIGTDAFTTNYAGEFVIRCSKGSFAEQYAKNNSISLSYILASPRLRAQARTNNSIHLYWNKINGADMYLIYLISDSDNKIYLDKTYDTEFDVTGLSGNTSYKYYVRAMSEDETSSSDYSDKYVVSAKTICDSPELTLTNFSHYIQLNWQNVDGASRYNIYTVSEDGKNKSKIASVTASQYTYNNLPVGKEYSFFVSIVDAGGNESKFNNEKVVKTSTICEQPEFDVKPSWVSIDVTWKPVEGAEYYGIFYYSSSSAGYQLADYSYTSNTDYTYTIGGRLSFTKSYKVLVRAYNKMNEGSRFDKKSGQSCKLRGYWIMMSGIVLLALFIIVFLIIIIVKNHQRYYEVEC